MLLCFSLAACGGGSSSPGVTPTASPTFTIVLKQAYTDTGFSLTAGEKITISTNGTVDNGQCATCSFTADGAAWTTCANDPPPAFLAPGLRCWSLIGKIGATGTPFQVGTSLALTAATAGELFLGINDNDYGDNTGSWTTTIAKS